MTRGVSTKKPHTNLDAAVFTETGDSLRREIPLRVPGSMPTIGSTREMAVHDWARPDGGGEELEEGEGEGDAGDREAVTVGERYACHTYIHSCIVSFRIEPCKPIGLLVRHIQESLCDGWVCSWSHQLLG